MKGSEVEGRSSAKSDRQRAPFPATPPGQGIRDERPTSSGDPSGRLAQGSARGTARRCEQVLEFGRLVLVGVALTDRLSRGESAEQGVRVATKRWNDLAPRVRRLIVVTGVIEGVLKIAALIDLARRPPADVRGSKARWAAAISLANSAGAVPIIYFRYGRRR